MCRIGYRIIALALSLVVVTGLYLTWVLCCLLPLSNDAIAPVPLDQLGLATDHAKHAAVVAQSLPPFKIFGADGEDNSRKNVRLWDAVLQVRGEHLPNIPQQIGDCVSFGSANAENYLQYQQIASGQAEEFHPASTLFNYGASRVTIGRQHGSHFSGDGSVGAYAAEAAQSAGVLPADHPKCPPYDGATARAWGKTGPPKWALEVAAKFKVQTIAQMTSSDDVMNANANRYPVIICSDFGTKTIRPQDGRMVARHDASWGHCMCVIAYDGSGPRPYFYVLNSWGPDAHPKPLQGEPPGGFWIDKKTLDYIVRSGDCWAFSAFDGFPAQELDLSPLRPRRAAVQPGLRKSAREVSLVQGSKA